tara:strand:+ start:284 stop:484 length:201 start_codon:yes stop_codon:yes gene_type:complete
VVEEVVLIFTLAQLQVVLEVLVAEELEVEMTVQVLLLIVVVVEEAVDKQVGLEFLLVEVAVKELLY